jgi:hypothetical protein
VSSVVSTDDSRVEAASSLVVSLDTESWGANRHTLSTGTSSDHITLDIVLCVVIVIADVVSAVSNGGDASWVVPALSSVVHGHSTAGSAGLSGRWEPQSGTWYIVFSITIIVADSISEVISDGADTSSVERSSSVVVGLDTSVDADLSALGAVITSGSNSSLGHVIFKITVIIVDIVRSVGVHNVDGTWEPLSAASVVDLHLLVLAVPAVVACGWWSGETGGWHGVFAVAIVVANVVQAVLVSAHSGSVESAVVLVVNSDTGVVLPLTGRAPSWSVSDPLNGHSSLGGSVGISNVIDAGRPYVGDDTSYPVSSVLVIAVYVLVPRVP